MDIFDSAYEKLSAAWAAGDSGRRQDISADTITIIIDIAKSLMASCQASAPAIKAKADTPTLGTMFAVRLHVRQELRDRFGFGGYAKHNGDKIVQTIITAGSAATAEEIEAFSQA